MLSFILNIYCGLACSLCKWISKCALLFENFSSKSCIFQEIYLRRKVMYIFNQIFHKMFQRTMYCTLKYQNKLFSPVELLWMFIICATYQSCLFLWNTKSISSIYSTIKLTLLFNQNQTPWQHRAIPFNDASTLQLEPILIFYFPNGMELNIRY